MAAYYNECDAFAAQWLRNLIAAGHIAPGEVDERSIADVQPADLVGYTQCHFFAGIGGWSYALRLAGWPDDRPVWTASCPCQPYSVGSVAHGGAKGQGDSRHLWPYLPPLLREHRPPVLFGEQVTHAISWGWWDEVCGDLEQIGYACGAALLPASAVEADHERKRLLWVAHTGREGWTGHQSVPGFPVAATAALALPSHDFSRIRRAMAGDYSGLLPGDGVSVAVERSRTKGYGNAIVPQVAAEFIRAYCDTVKQT